MIVCGIAGSLRGASYNRALLRAAQELAPPDMEIRIFERLGELPPFNADLEQDDDPEPVRALKHAIAGANALLIATPEYNHGVPGVLKNALDWASRPTRASALIGKPTAIFGASPGATGTAHAQSQLRQAFVFTATPVLLEPEIMVYRAREKIRSGRTADGPEDPRARRPAAHPARGVDRHVQSVHLTQWAQTACVTPPTPPRRTARS